MKFDNNLYEELVRRPLMLMRKADENSRALALNEKVGENYSLTRISCEFGINKITNGFLLV